MFRFRFIYFKLSERQFLSVLIVGEIKDSVIDLENKEYSAQFASSMSATRDWQIKTTKTLFHNIDEYSASKNQLSKICEDKTILAVVFIVQMMPAKDVFKIATDIKAQIKPKCLMTVAPVYSFNKQDVNYSINDSNTCLTNRLQFFATIKN